MNHLINKLIAALNGLGGGFSDYAGNMFVQSSVLIILLLIIDLLLRKRVRATFRYWIWMLVFVKLILPPSLSLPTGIGYWYGDALQVNVSESKDLSDIVQTEPAASVIPERISSFAPESEAVTQPSEILPVQPAQIRPQANASIEQADPDLIPLTRQGVLFGLWLTGVVVITILLLQRIMFVKGLVAQSEPADDNLIEMLNQCRKKIGIERKIEVRLLNNIQSPAVCGLFSPVILIPKTLLAKLSDEKLKTVLIHELAHLKRGDLWINCAQTLLQIIYFYNPLIWLVNVIVCRVREQAVDEMVLVTLGPQAKTYSNTLIDIAEMAFFKTSLSLRLIGVVESKKALSGRIKHMLARPVPKNAKLGLFGLLAIIITAAILLPMAKGQSSGIDSFDENTLIKFDSESDYLGNVKTVGDEKVFSKTYAVRFRKGEKLLVVAELYRAGEPMQVIGHKVFDSPMGAEKLSGSFSYSKVDQSKIVTTHHGSVKLGQQVFVLPEFSVDNFPSSTWWGWFSGDALRQSNDRLGRDYKAMEVLFYYAGSCSDTNNKAKFWIPASNTTPVEVPYAFVLKAIPLSRLEKLYVVPIGGYQGLNGQLIEPEGFTVEKADAIADEYKQRLLRIVDDKPIKTYTITLSNGVTVELVGLCVEPVDDARWWKSDGSEMPEPSFEANRRTPPMQVVPVRYTFLARAQGGENISMRMKIYEGSGWSTQVAPDGTALCYVKHLDDSQPYHEDAFEKGPIEIGVAQGQWIKGRGSSSPNIQMHRSYLVGNDDQIVIQPPQAEKSSPEMATIFWATASSNDYEYRLVCTLKDASIKECMKPFFQSTNVIETGGLSNSKLQTLSFNIDVPLDQIVNYELFYRKFNYVRFYNVAFRPGVKTDVQVQAGSDEKVDYSSVVVAEGIGFDCIVVGDARCTAEFIKSRMGQPDEEVKDEKTGWWLNYVKPYGLDLWLNLKENILLEIRLNEGFKGKLTSGISLSSTKQDVFNTYGRPLEEKTVTDLTKHFDNQVLYQIKSKGLFRKVTNSKIFYRQHGLLFWFQGDRILQIVIHRKNVKTNMQVEVEGTDVPTEREDTQVKTVLLPDVDSKALMLDLVSGELLDVPKKDDETQIWSAIEKLGKGDLVFDASSLILVRGATTQSSTETIIEPFKAYKIEQKLPVSLTITTKEGENYAIKVLSADNEGCRLEYHSLGKREEQTKQDDAISTVSREQHFVMLVVGREKMTFEGNDVTWEQLPQMLEKVQNRPQTVLCMAIDSEEMTISQLNQMQAKTGNLSRQFGFEYFSYVGVHPLGSSGSGETDTHIRDEGALTTNKPRALSMEGDHEVIAKKLTILEHERELLGKKINNYRKMILELGQEYGAVELKEQQKMMLDRVRSLLDTLITVTAERIGIETEIQLLEHTGEQPIAPDKLLEIRLNYINQNPMIVAYIKDITELEQEIIVARQTKVPMHPEIQRKTALLEVLKERLKELKQQASEDFDEILKKEAAAVGDKQLIAKRNELEQKKAYEKRLHGRINQEDSQAIKLGRKQLTIEKLQSQLELAQKWYETILLRIRDLEMQRKRSENRDEF